MMSEDKSEKDKPDTDDQPQQKKVPPARGKTFGSRGTEKKG